MPGSYSSSEEAAAFPLIGVTAWNALTGGRALQAGDTVLTLGSPSDIPALNVVRAAVAGAVTIRSIAAGNRAHFLAMNRAIVAHQFKPIIDRIFPFDDAQAAYRYYQEGQHFGKVIIRHQ